MNYASSDYTVFHDQGNDMDEFHKDLDFGWGTVSDGNFTVPAGESYMTPTDIPNTPSGWHGPSYVHVLDRPFRLSQLSEFSVIGEMVQTSSSKMGKTYVALFDENKQIVMLILWGDSWTGSIKGYFNVYFYPQDSGGSALGTGYIYTSFKKTGKLWWGSYPGEEGSVFSSIEGVDGTTKLAECDNASRVIKYVALLGYRYSGYPLADMRIHDINVAADLKWSQRAVTLLDPCNDVDNFESDPDFGWGVVTDGDLTVPQGAGYMTPANIPGTPTGWHGPNWVHELEESFILNDLRLFYIQAEILQYYDKMGKMDVALFDENMQCVLNIYWGDSWNSLEKGYFHVVYYPEGGGSASDTTGYIYSSFWRMGELKVEDGHVMYEISDDEEELESGDLGEVVNPFRMIKYLVIRPSRHSGYSLIDLRLHAIGLYAGQSTSVPEPEDSDGTSQSSDEALSGQYEDSFDQTSTEASDSVTVYWTGPWPELHVIAEKYIAADTEVTIESKIDILGFTEIEECSIKAMGVEDYTEEEADEFTDQMEESFLSSELWATIILFVGGAFVVLLGLAEILSAIPFFLSVMQFGLLCVAIGVAYILFLATLLASMRDQGASNYEQSLTLLSLGLGLLMLTGEAAITLKGLKLGFMKMLSYFSKSMLKSAAKYVSTGISNVFLFWTTIILIVVTVALAWAVMNEVV